MGDQQANKMLVKTLAILALVLAASAERTNEPVSEQEATWREHMQLEEDEVADASLTDMSMFVQASAEADRSIRSRRVAKRVVRRYKKVKKNFKPCEVKVTGTVLNSIKGKCRGALRFCNLYKRFAKRFKMPSLLAVAKPHCKKMAKMHRHLAKAARKAFKAAARKRALKLRAAARKARKARHARWLKRRAAARKARKARHARWLKRLAARHARRVKARKAWRARWAKARKARRARHARWLKNHRRCMKNKKCRAKYLKRRASRRKARKARKAKWRKRL